MAETTMRSTIGSRVMVAKRRHRWFAAVGGAAFCAAAVVALAFAAVDGSSSAGASTESRASDEPAVDMDKLLGQPSMTPAEIGVVANHLDVASYRFLPSIPLTMIDVEGDDVRVIGRVNLDTGEARKYGDAVESGDTFHHGMIHNAGDETATAVLATDDAPVVDIPPDSILVVGTFVRELRQGSSPGQCQASCDVDGFAACCAYNEPGELPGCACRSLETLDAEPCDAGGPAAVACKVSRDDERGSYACDVECDTDEAWATCRYDAAGEAMPTCHCEQEPENFHAGGRGADGCGLSQQRHEAEEDGD